MLERTLFKFDPLFNSKGNMAVEQAGISYFETEGSITKYNGIVFCCCSQILMFSILITGYFFLIALHMQIYSHKENRICPEYRHI